MIDVENLKLGDTVYLLDTTNNSFSKQKIKFVDLEGIEWFRYDRPDRTYKIVKYTYCGAINYSITGDIGEDEPTPNEYYFINNNGEYYNFNLYDKYFWEECYYNLEDANTAMAEQDMKWNQKTTTT